MPLEMRIKKQKLLATVFTAVAYICWLWVYMWCEDRTAVSAGEITVVSVLGVITVAAYFFIWWRKTGRIFMPWNIFLAFFTVFSFGQCLLWAVGIHVDEEIGRKLVFSTLAADNHVILLAQLIFVISFIFLNYGALLLWNPQTSEPIQQISENSLGNEKNYKYLLYTSVILGAIVIPITLYNAINRFYLVQAYGYRSLYYGDAREFTLNPVVNILSTLFLPCLLGLLIGSHYEKKMRFLVYCVFAVYAITTLFSGDRGEWINAFLFLLLADFSFYKKRSGKALLVFAIMGVACLSVVDAIVSMRNTGMTWNGFVNALQSPEKNAIISMLTEFGQSMGISMLLIDYPVQEWHGNTILMSIPTVFGTGLFNGVFGMEYVQLHTWYPEFLGISYGTDFSMIGEAMLNYGVYMTPIVILIEGAIIFAIAQFSVRFDKGPLWSCIGIGLMAKIVLLPRSTVWLVLNGVVYMLIIFPVTYWIVKHLCNIKK